MLFALETDTLRGPINVTSPQPVRHAEFMADLAKRRRSLVGVKAPAGLMRAFLGELAQLFVDGQKVLPVAAFALGFKFRFEKLHGALNDLLSCKPVSHRVRSCLFSSLPASYNEEIDQHVDPKRSHTEHNLNLMSKTIGINQRD